MKLCRYSLLFYLSIYKFYLIYSFKDKLALIIGIIASLRTSTGGMETDREGRFNIDYDGILSHHRLNQRREGTGGHEIQREGYHVALPKV